MAQRECTYFGQHDGNDNELRDMELALTIFGTGGGLATIYYWWNLYSSRRRIKARIDKETYSLKEQPLMEVTLEFEVINLGDKTTSLDNRVVIKAATPKGEPKRFVLEVTRSDRELPSNVPRQFVALGKISAIYPFAWFRRYKICVSRGKGTTILHRSASGDDIGFVRFWFEYIKFVWFGRLPESALESLWRDH